MKIRKRRPGSAKRAMAMAVKFASTQNRFPDPSVRAVSFAAIAVVLFHSDRTVSAMDFHWLVATLMLLPIGR